MQAAPRRRALTPTRRVPNANGFTPASHFPALTCRELRQPKRHRSSHDGMGFLSYLAFLAAAIPLLVLWHVAVPAKQKARLADLWRTLEPRASPYLVVLWMVLCVFLVPLISFYSALRR